MQRFLPTVALAAAALLPVGCSSIHVTTEHAPGIRFQDIKTYSWRGAPTPGADRQPTEGEDVDVVWFDGLVREAVDATLAAKGLVLVPDEDADVLVRHFFDVSQQVRVNDPYYAYSEVEVYDEGTLVLDLYDARSRMLIWRGVAHKELDETAPIDERAANVRRVVEKILDRYPPEK